MQGLRIGVRALRLAPGPHAGGQRRLAPPGGLPVMRELGRDRRPCPGQLGMRLEVAGQRRMQPRPLARKHLGVRRLAQQRVAEGEGIAPRGRHQHLLGDRSAQRVGQLAGPKPGRPRHQLLIDPPACGRRHAHDVPRGAGQPVEPHEQRLGQRSRQRLRAGLPGGREQLLGVEGVALRAIVEPVERGRRQLRRAQHRDVIGELGARERRERDAGDAGVPPELDEIRAERMAAREAFGPARQHEREPLARSAAHEKAQQVAGRAVGPVEVLDDEQHRRALAEPAHGSEHELEQARLGERRHRIARTVVGSGELGHEPPEHGPIRPEDRFGLLLGQAGEQAAQRAGDRRVRQLSVADVDAPTDQHADPLVLRRPGELLDQPALAHARLAGDHDRGASARRRRAQPPTTASPTRCVAPQGAQPSPARAWPTVSPTAGRPVTPRFPRRPPRVRSRGSRAGAGRARAARRRSGARCGRRAPPRTGR